MAPDWFNKLSAVSRFSISARDDNKWEAGGHGTVDIELHGNRCVIWREQGRWDNAPGNLAFSNTYRWTTLSASEFQLEHLRYGDEHPVKLVTIRQIDRACYQVKAPHYCHPDSYSLEFSVRGSQLHLTWWIKGPNKNQHTSICYR